MNDVNLLPDVQVSSMAENRLKSYLIAATAVISILWVVCTGGLYIFEQMSIKKLDLLDGRIKESQFRIEEKKDLGLKLITLKQKLAGIAFINNYRYNFPEALKYVLKIFPNGVSATRVSIDDKGEVVLNLTSVDSTAAAGFVSQMGVETILKSPRLESLTLSDEGKYAFVISAKYDKSKK